MSKSAAEWVSQDDEGGFGNLSYRAVVEMIQADAFAAGAAAQRESDISAVRKQSKIAAVVVRNNPLVTLPKGET